MKYQTLDHRLPYRQYWVGVLVGVCLLFLLEKLGGMVKIRGAAENFLQPSQQLGVQIISTVELPYRVITTSYRSYQSLQLLQVQYGQLAALVGQQTTLQTENETLRKMVNATMSSGEKKKILVPILGYSQPLIANQDHTYEVGDPVFIEGVLIGRVSRLSQNQAEVKLLSQLFTQPILAKTVSGSTGLIYGNGQDLVLKELPIEQQVEIGQQVYTVGQDGVMPNWYLGRIKELHRHEGAPTQEAVVEQGVSFFTNKMVEVK